MSADIPAIPVLVVDDSEVVRTIVVTILRDIGFRDIVQARDGTEALRQVEAARPGLIICDINMQPMDGLAFLDALRRHPWVPAAAIPVIFMTVHTETAIVQQATQLGAEGYIVKPVQRKALEAQVLKVLARASAGKS